MGDHVMGDHVMGDHVMGDHVMGDHVMGDHVMGDHVMGDHVMGDHVMGDHVMGDHVMGDSVSLSHTFSIVENINILKYVSHLGPGDIKTIEIPRNIVEILIKLLYQNHLKSSTLCIYYFDLSIFINLFVVLVTQGKLYLYTHLVHSHFLMYTMV